MVYAYNGRPFTNGKSQITDIQIMDESHNIMLSKEANTKVCILGDPSHMKF